ncbi:hypothetical protein [Candidatus Regiella endosymbiont of Tuberolachnus salignus]|uniref:hypothetical protein n=1 Tax=Candidatus Regiella endosymbiont of Tuberolachnus salignus TaxID=3077956 RepID=UPI0030CDA86C
MLISLMALSPQRKLHSGLSGQIKLAIYGLLSLALTRVTTWRSRPCSGQVKSDTFLRHLD